MRLGEGWDASRGSVSIVEASISRRVNFEDICKGGRMQVRTKFADRVKEKIYLFQLDQSRRSGFAVGYQEKGWRCINFV